MRNMSFSITTKQVEQQTKTVTRRIGWSFLKPGDLVQPIEKGMGLKKGEKVKRIGPPIKILSVSHERLSDVTEADIEKEGFPGITVQAFVHMFSKSNHYCETDCPVARIEFKYEN